MSESGNDYDPGVWRGYDYTSARNAYDPGKVDPNAGRGYSTPPSYTAPSYSRSGAVGDAVPDTIKSEKKYPVAIITDGTGSMGDFPEVIFKKLPVVDNFIKEYLGEDFDISYSMIGDYGDGVPPLQVRPFSRGKDMVDAINALRIGRGGGGNAKEAYELAASYYARNVEMPNAKKPILIWICDEGVYEHVEASNQKTYAKVDLKESMTDKELFDELKKKWSVYVIRKHYGENPADGEKMTGDNLQIQRQWVRLVGEDRIAILNDANRVVDVILGLMAVETGKEDFFTQEIKDRQTAAQVDTIMKSMRTVGSGAASKTAADPAAAVKSVTKKPADGDGKSKLSKSLI